MKRYLDRLQKEHRRLNRLIDGARHDMLQHEMKTLKQLRLNIKDRIAALQRSAAPGDRWHKQPTNAPRLLR